MEEFESKIIHIILSLNGSDLINLANADYCNTLIKKIAILVPLSKKIIFKETEYVNNSTTKKIIARYYVRVAQILSAVIRSIQPLINNESWETYIACHHPIISLDYMWKTCIDKIHSLVQDDIRHLFKDVYKNGNYELSTESSLEYSRLIEFSWNSKNQLFKNYIDSLYKLRSHLQIQQYKVLAILSFLFHDNKLVFLTIDELECVVKHTKETLEELFKVRDEACLSAMHIFEVFVEKTKMDKTISRIRHLEERLNLFF